MVRDSTQLRPRTQDQPACTTGAQHLYDRWTAGCRSIRREFRIGDDRTVAAVLQPVIEPERRNRGKCPLRRVSCEGGDKWVEAAYRVRRGIAARGRVTLFGFLWFGWLSNACNRDATEESED